jgi:hypothetical protein
MDEHSCKFMQQITCGPQARGPRKGVPEAGAEVVGVALLREVAACCARWLGGAGRLPGDDSISYREFKLIQDNIWRDDIYVVKNFNYQLYIILNN